jgi:hypothetical protein
MSNPQARVTVDTAVFDKRGVVSSYVVMNENGFDVADIVFSDLANKCYPSVIDEGKAVTVEVKDASDSAWIKLFVGVVRIVKPKLSKQGNMVEVKCDGAGYGFADMKVCQEYGDQSNNPTLDTLKEILSDASYGVVPKYVNKILGGATDSGFNYTTATVETVTGTIHYLLAPYKNASKVLGDLCDLVTAIKAGGAGPIWRVDVDDKLYVKLCDAAVTGWPLYPGGVEITVEEGMDFVDPTFEHLQIEANHVTHYGVLRKPPKDVWSENSASLWGATGLMTVSDESGADNFKVGAYSLKCVTTGAANAYYPSGKDAAWDLSKIYSDRTVPTLNFWEKHPANVSAPAISIGLCTDSTHRNYYSVNPILGSADAKDWTQYHVPIGSARAAYGVWVGGVGVIDWTNVNWIELYASDASTSYWDDIHFEGHLARVAKNSTKIAASKAKMAVLTDFSLGKDDSLKESDDSGVFAQLAYAELLKLQTDPIVGNLTVPMMLNLLPGQQLHVKAKKKLDGTFSIDKHFRVYRLTQAFSADGFISRCEVTDDLLNSHPRMPYNDVNKVLQSIRPEFQDRQATSIKTGVMDIYVPRLEKDYPS